MVPYGCAVGSTAHNTRLLIVDIIAMIVSQTLIFCLASMAGGHNILYAASAEECDLGREDRRACWPCW